MPIYRFGTEEQRQKWLPKLVTGEALAGFGLTEPGCGSDAGATQTRAVFDPDTNEWVINGSKIFITNSGTDITALVTVTAVTGTREDGSKEISTIIVPNGTPGVHGAAELLQGRLVRLRYARASTSTTCRVPAENLLGERGRGFAQFLQILDEGRIAIAALAVGLGQGCIDESLKYAQQRQAFGQPISNFQAIQFMLADMEVRTHTSRLAYYEAARKMLAGEPFKKEAAIAKLYASECAVDSARAATQIHGGYGFMNETPVARFWRDSKILEIGEGTSEIQRMVIAREMGVGSV